MDIQSVARRAKVSTATVSRVLNGSALVREGTAARVRKAIDELKYIPNTSARVLRSGRSSLFGLIVSDVRNPFFPDLIENFEALSTEHGIDVIFTNTGYQEDRLLVCVQRLLERGVDGIAIMTSEVSPHVFRKLGTVRIPAVFLNQPSLGSQFCNVRVDYARGFRDAVEHLRMLGHLNIAFISGPPALGSAVRRKEAFLSAMQACQLPIQEKWLLEGDHKIGGGVHAMQKLIKMRARPTAIVCSNDLTAVGALQAALSKNIHVPGDLSLVGFDDLYLSEMLHPPLTTMHLSRHEIATRAFFALYAWRSNGTAPAKTPVIMPRLIVRSSTGPPSL